MASAALARATMESTTVGKGVFLNDVDDDDDDDDGDSDEVTHPLSCSKFM
eukprot:CAMPEP_0198117610 /NCGR_PEP_ID=MMETSP1442-20131203/18679_1 /TAXON_ID= /ORGANISM="Craspedostauros australis, Strain CCMP3328" /LENGTH=49 /DNA_ID=CAMNT_0043775697 /DNA_START=10 /DNA_END=159 /DNA_ORIENTATION=+